MTEQCGLDAWALAKIAIVIVTYLNLPFLSYGNETKIQWMGRYCIHRCVSVNEGVPAVGSMTLVVSRSWTFLLGPNFMEGGCTCHLNTLFEGAFRSITFRCRSGWKDTALDPPFIIILDCQWTAGLILPGLMGAGPKGGRCAGLGCPPLDRQT